MPVSADWNAHANWRRARTRFRPAAACGCSRLCHNRASSAKGKDFDTGNVLGPCIVTSDELSDPYALTLEARVNGELWGAGRTRDMHHRWEDVIAHVSRSETLYAGEVIGAGTVANGCGLEVGRFLQEGALVEISAKGIGTLTNRLVRA
jgi:2-keto-4-pentenoate hydratase/2-oxohepta-3-ene-1,7-dioic acid hydratase in catechol pathway